MAQARRKNERVLFALRALAIGALTAMGLAGMSARPTALPIAVGILVGGLALASTELAVLVAVIALTVPVIAVQPVVGFMMLIVLVASIRYLGGDGARAFMVLGLSLVGAFLGPVWAGVALAGYLFGTGEGALAAVVACLVVEVTGLVLGKPMFGVTYTGASAQAIVSFAKMPETLLSGAWLTHAISALDTKAVSRTLGGFAATRQPLVLLLQLGIWGLGGFAAGAISANARKAKSLPLSLAAVLTGVALPAAGAMVLGRMFSLKVSSGAVALSFVTSLLIAGVFVIIRERVFPPIKVVKTAPPRKASMATEDADVDELLRLIATAEDKLAAQHTSVRVVMITDMKSFSRMTEEEGSVATAKAIQRHRDLLLPVIQSHNGCGKSTGGDGLVASFESAAEALAAAADMQRTLTMHNAAHPDEREIWIRIGIAHGEVVLDKGGRPFIGAALNLAARVMNLADGGQVFATADVGASAAEAGVSAFSFGDFELKNIAKPVEVVEILWAEGQAPIDPRETGTAVASPE